ncbi:MAG: ABC transporter ATP-binding protein [Clostridiales bacterium]|nr:ABC transporter ATP-binding protein [Clostridiales bacterium]
MTSRAAIEVEDLEVAFISREIIHPVLEGVSLEVVEGGFTALLGPSGCGKSTLLNAIAGLLKPVEGRIFVLGKEVQGPSPEVGYMFQQDYLLPWRTVEKNIHLAWELRGERPIQERTLALLEEVGLGDALHKYPHELSGGMRQRVALVRTLAPEPAVLLLDEPFSALDYLTRLRLGDLVQKVLKRHQKTVLFVTHDIPEAISLADRIILLGGRPATVQREFRVPPHFQGLASLERRTDPAFQPLFQQIWEEMKRLDGEGMD